MSDLLPPPRSTALTATGENAPAWRGHGDEGEPILEQVDLKELLATIRRRWKLVATVAIASVAAAWSTAKSQRARYQATATIRLVDTRRMMTNGIDNQTPQYGGIGMWADPIQSQLQVLDSRMVATEVVKQHPLGLRVIPKGIGA